MLDRRHLDHDDPGGAEHERVQNLIKATARLLRVIGPADRDLEAKLHTVARLLEQIAADAPDRGWDEQLAMLVPRPFG